jgi:hypothetical protein
VACPPTTRFWGIRFKNHRCFMGCVKRAGTKAAAGILKPDAQEWNKCCSGDYPAVVLPTGRTTL